jgi:phage shock protein A
MGVFKRVGHILSANLNDLVERFESPEIMLRQALREMDSALDRTMEATARTIADERLLGDQLARSRAQSAGCERLARDAVRRGEDQAARRALASKRDEEKLIAALDDQLAATRAVAARLRRRLQAMRVRRAEAERKLHVLVARERAAAAQRQFMFEARESCGANAGLARFERMWRRVERREAESEALLELSGLHDADSAGEAEDTEIESQLETLKRGAK